MDFFESHLGEEQREQLSPIVLHCLWSVYIGNHPVEAIGETACRELRTMADSMDHMLRGSSLCALDMLMQRFKRVVCFFVIKENGVSGEGQTRVTRLIFIMAPVNEFLVLQKEDMSSLTPSTSWVVIAFPDGRVLIWSGDDQKGAFFVWSLPEAWLPFMTICKPVTGHRVGRPDLALAFLSLCGIPMGWVLEVTLFHHLHQRGGFKPAQGRAFTLSIVFGGRGLDPVLLG